MRTKSSFYIPIFASKERPIFNKMGKKRNNTHYWENNKPWRPWCLCYSEEKGLYKQLLTEYETSSDFLYRPHGYKGYVSDTIELEEKGITIKIQSNFGYGSWAYLRAIVEQGNLRILDFCTTNLYILNNCSVKSFIVPVYQWDSLFNKIIAAYNEAISGEYNRYSIAYIEELEEMLDKNEIEIKGDFEKEKTVKWEGAFLISLFAGNKIRDLIEGFEMSRPMDTTLLNHMLNLCRKFIHKVKSQEYDNINDSRLKQL